MTNREMFLLATSILFASTTLGIALQGVLHKSHHEARPGFEHRMKGHYGKNHKRPDFFAKADTNNDGFLTKEEMLIKQQQRLDVLFATVDTDKDGKLSKEELEKGRKLMFKKMKERFQDARQKTEDAQ